MLPYRATTHQGYNVVGKRLTWHTDRRVAEGESGEGQGSEPGGAGGTVTGHEVCFKGPPTRSRGTHITLLD